MLPPFLALLCPEGTLPPRGEGSKVLPNIPLFFVGHILGISLPKHHLKPWKLTDLAKPRSQGKIRQGPCCLLCACLSSKRLGTPSLRYI